MIQQGKGWENQTSTERATSPHEHLLPPPQEMPRIKRTPMPLHSGFGFGAQEIQEKSLRIARASSDKKQARIRDLLQEPLPSPKRPPSASAPTAAMPGRVGTPTLDTDLRTDVRAQSDVSAADMLSDLNQLGPMEELPVTSRPQTTQTVTPTAQPKSKPTYLTTRVKKKEIAVPMEVERAQAFLAWLFDLTVGVTSFVVSAGANYAFAGSAINTYTYPLAEKLCEQSGIASPNVMNYWMRTGATGILIVMFFQFWLTFFSGATAGRYALRFKHTYTSFIGRLWAAACAATSEGILLGGLLGLPLVILMPSRMPLSPWVKFMRIEWKTIYPSNKGTVVGKPK